MYGAFTNQSDIRNLAEGGGIQYLDELDQPAGEQSDGDSETAAHIVKQVLVYACSYVSCKVFQINAFLTKCRYSANQRSKSGNVYYHMSGQATRTVAALLTTQYCMSMISSVILNLC